MDAGGGRRLSKGKLREAQDKTLYHIMTEILKNTCLISICSLPWLTETYIAIFKPLEIMI